MSTPQVSRRFELSNGSVPRQFVWSQRKARSSKFKFQSQLGERSKNFGPVAIRSSPCSRADLHILRLADSELGHLKTVCLRRVPRLEDRSQSQSTRGLEIRTCSRVPHPTNSDSDSVLRVTSSGLGTIRFLPGR